MDNHKAAILNDFIRIQISPEYLSTHLLKPEEFDRLIIKSSEIREKFTSELFVDAMVASHEFEKVSLITGYQALFSFLVNKVQGYIQNNPNSFEINNLYEFIRGDLIFCLDFIQKYFPNYFDKAALVPTYYWEHFLTAVKEAESQFEFLSSITSVDAGLKTFLFYELKNISSDTLSFQMLSYLKNFLSGLLNEFKFNTETDHVSRLLGYCVACNFNSLAFKKHCTFFYKKVLTQLSDDEEKKNWLKLTLKYLNQLPINNEMSLFTKGISIKEFLVNWLEQEQLSLGADQKEKAVIAHESIPKINTSVSVPVLALLTRMFKEAGIITNANLQEVFRFFSTHYTSQRKEAISLGSFHGKYYNVEEGTKRKVTDLLLEMVKTIRKIP